jgi:hypothetical protein
VLHGAVELADDALEASADALLRHLLDPELDPGVRLARLLGRMEETSVVL